MNLSNLVHRAQPTPSQQQRSSQNFADPHRRLRHDYRQDMATALTASPYTSQSPVFTRPPPAPPSPPNDDLSSLRTLPSIQSLIGMEVPLSSQDQQCEFLLIQWRTCEAYAIVSGCRGATNSTLQLWRSASKHRPSIAELRSANREQS